jgi:hypothetical protein
LSAVVVILPKPPSTGSTGVLIRHWYVEVLSPPLETQLGVWGLFRSNGLLARYPIQAGTRPGRLRLLTGARVVDDELRTRR